MRICVTGRGNRLELGVAEPDDLAIGEGMVVELDARARREVRRGAGARHELGQTGDMIGLHVRLEDGDDREVMGTGESEVCVDELEVGIDYRELTTALAAEEI
jgi:hypothetical protein